MYSLQTAKHNLFSLPVSLMMIQLVFTAFLLLLLFLFLIFFSFLFHSSFYYSFVLFGFIFDSIESQFGSCRMKTLRCPLYPRAVFSQKLINSRCFRRFRKYSPAKAKEIRIRECKIFVPGVNCIAKTVCEFIIGAFSCFLHQINIHIYILVIIMSISSTFFSSFCTTVLFYSVLSSSSSSVFCSLSFSTVSSESSMQNGLFIISLFRVWFVWLSLSINLIAWLFLLRQLNDPNE